MLRSLLATFSCLIIVVFVPCLTQSVDANVNYEVSLQAGQITPSSMSAKLNETVNIHVTNRGSKPHNLVIKDFYIFTQDLKPGEDVNLSFTPNKRGTFAYYSDTGGKPEPGMRGQIQVQ